MLHDLIDAVLQAGRAILEVYAEDFSIEKKADDSPLTAADRASHRILMKALSATGLPVLSEEGRDIPYAERKDWDRYWLIDPLDGTKEFIRRNGEFTVNVALVERGVPVQGWVYAPVPDKLYFGRWFSTDADTIAWRSNDCRNKSPEEIVRTACSLSPRIGGSPLRVVASKSHCNEETQAFIEELERHFGPVERVSKGSSLKLCMIAEGSADIYPRIAPTMEWDTAAAHAVICAAGGEVLEYFPEIPARAYYQPASAQGKERFCPLRYNKPDLLNPSFVAVAHRGRDDE